MIPFAVENRAGIASSDVQYWVSVLLAVYGAALLAGSPIFGWIADQTPNRRLPLLGGLVVLIGATAMLLVGNSIGLLIAGRVLQGFAGAIVWCTGLALLVDTVGSQHVGQYLGYVAMSMSLALLLAPLLGGVVYANAGYVAVFAMCFGLIGLDIVLRLTLVEKKVAAKWIKTDVAVADSDAAATSEKQDDTQKEPQEDLTTTSPPKAFVTDIPTSIAPRQRRNIPPVISLLASPRMLAALYASLVEASIMTAFDATLPLRVRTIFHWTSLGAGLIFLPLIVPTFVSPITGYLCDRYGAARWLASAGFLLATPWAVLLRLVTHDSLDQKVLLCALLALIGLSLVLTLPPLMAEIGYVVEMAERRRPGVFGAKGAYAQAYGLFNMAFAAGGLVGPIWGGLVQARAGWGTMGWTLGLLSGTTAVPTALLVGGWLFANKKEREMQAHVNV